MFHFYLRTTPADKVKVIITVSKKVSKLAVTRNTVRRRVRPLVQEFITDLKPANYFIVAKPEADKLKGQNLKLELAELFKKV